MRSLSLLAKKEFNALLSTPAFWLFLLCVSLLTGYSFIEAARLFAEASRSAAQSPALARGLSPLDGIFVPTFGGLYLASTLLFPFLAIRFVSSEKESGSIKLSLQLPVSLERIIGAKVSALVVGWSFGLAVPISTSVLWIAKGGHVGGWEFTNLVIGHSLYAFSITGIAVFAASLGESASAAALLTLAVVLANWSLDFAASTQTGRLRDAAAFSLAACLHSFEKGLFAWPQACVLLILGFTGLACAAAWLRLGEIWSRRIGKMVLIAITAILFTALSIRRPFYRDVSEDKRNSFKPTDEQALSHLEKPLTVKVYLNPEDSRLWDLDRSVLSKLRRAVPNVRITLESIGSAMGTGGDDRYGIIRIEYGVKLDETRSTSEEEILPIIYGLTGQKVLAGLDWDYPGYPLNAQFPFASAWFYFVIPALLAAGWWRVGRKTS